MSDYGRVPSKAKAHPKPFTAHVPDDTLSEFKQLVKLSKIGPAVYENQQQDRRFGITRDWLVDAKEYWETTFDWRAHEKHINSFPNFTLPIKDDDGEEYTIHFVALFSEKEDAIPIAFYHGWPGSFLEFLPMLEVIKKRYSAKDLPYHIIIPSLPGYTYSSGPPVGKDMQANDMPTIMNKLMIALGFGDGYVAQGGDIGSLVSRQSAKRFPECKAFHLNMNIMFPPENADKLPLDEIEKKFFPQVEKFTKLGSAYASEHGQRTATIGLVLSSNPIALLAWIGEKFLEWTDQDPEMETILESVTLYWLTSTFPRCIYPYRSFHGPNRTNTIKSPHDSSFHTGNKPMGFSWFPHDLTPVPRSWIEQSTDNLLFYRQHQRGGHFAALEAPDLLWGDVEEFVQAVYKTGGSRL